MLQTAADIGLHYAHIAVSEEPLQAAQFWTSLIALRAPHESSLEDALQQALAAVDLKSCVAEIVADARKAFHAHPDDWKAARQGIQEKWFTQRKWNGNSTPVNGTEVCLAVLSKKSKLANSRDFWSAVRSVRARLNNPILQFDAHFGARSTFWILRG